MTSPPPHVTRARATDWALATLVVVVTAVVSTWPLVTGPWLVPQHQDPLFSSWRLYQWARTLQGDSHGLFDGNIFHPTGDVQLFSDPMVLPALLGTPFLWTGVPVALVYSGLFWLSAISAGLAMFACARAVSGSRWGALVAAAMFTGAPLRLEQVVHLEMLWTAFLPLTVLATVRAFDGVRRAPWAVGGSMAAQFFCCIYYGVFLFTLWPVLAGVEWMRRRGAVTRSVMWRLAAGVSAGVLAIGAYALPFQRTRPLVGDRGDAEVSSYSASLASYVTASPINRTWGWTASDAPETRLFPGLVGSMLALSALTSPSAPWVAAIAVTTVAAVDASRGVHGWTYPVLRALPPYRGLRVPARFGMLVLAGLSVLAAAGCAALARTWGRRSRVATLWAVAILALIVGESAGDVLVRQLPRRAPPVYALLGTLPPTVVAHLPMPAPDALPGAEPDYQYFAQHHRHALVNGYSGFYPPTYLQLLDRVREFPDDRALEALRGAGVEYVLVHEQYYPTRAAFAAVAEGMERRPDVDPAATSTDEGGAVRVYRLLPK